MINLDSYIQTYYKGWRKISELESYKWVAFKHFKENYHNEYESVYDWIRTIFGKADNLLTSYRYLPLDVLFDFSCAKGEPDQLKELFGNLFQQGRFPTKENVLHFINGSKAIMQSMAHRGYSDWNGRNNLNTYQDAHAISVYLSMFYPNNFYIYKYGIFKDFAKIVDIRIASSDAIDRLFEYQSVCDMVKIELKKDKELIEFYNSWLKNNHFEDDNLNLLTQDFIYAVVKYLNSESFKNIKGNKERVGKYHEITAKELNLSPIIKRYSYKGVKGVDYHKISRRNEYIGVEGELWAVNFEKERLQKLNIDADNVKHSAKEDGDGCGYDILSVEDDGVTPRYIEVKTTSGSVTQPVFFSDNEKEFSIENREHYYIYRVYNFEAADKQADLTIVKASVDELKAEPVSYRVKIDYK